MTDQPSASSAPRGTRDSLRDLLANRNFDFYVGVRVAQMLGLSIQTAAIMWQVYELTGSALPLALIGVIRFIPNLILSFIAGAVTDVHDRRLVLGISQLPPLLTSLLLAYLTATGEISLTVIYVCTALLGIAGAFEGPSRQAILPLVVSRSSFQRAVAVATIVHQVAGVFGPAAAGIAIAKAGVAPAYVMHAALVAFGIVCLACIRMGSPTPSGGISLAMIKEGLAFIWTHPAILGAMALDMFAVILGGADALLPIFAKDILDVGAVGYGLLTASKAVGCLVVAVAMALLPPIVSTGRTMVITVGLFGIATVGFGLSSWFWLSLILYALIAAFDQVSVVLRQSIIQLGTPDELRGRVNSVNHVFVGASNQLGGTRAGFVATWADSAQFAVVSGGIGCLVAVVATTLLIPALWNLRQDLRDEEPAAAR
jgi:MFS family permease